MLTLSFALFPLVAAPVQGKFSGKLEPIPKLLPYQDWTKLLPKGLVPVNLIRDAGFEKPLGDLWHTHTLDNPKDGSPQQAPPETGERAVVVHHKGTYCFAFKGLTAKSFDAAKIIRAVNLTQWLPAQIPGVKIKTAGAWVLVQGKATLHFVPYYASGPGPSTPFVSKAGSPPWDWVWFDFAKGIDPYKNLIGIQFYIGSDEIGPNPTSSFEAYIDDVFVSLDKPLLGS